MIVVAKTLKCFVEPLAVRRGAVVVVKVQP